MTDVHRLTARHRLPYSTLRERLMESSASYDAAPRHRSETVECPACQGVGERCANPDNRDPQAVEFWACFLCNGKGEVTTRDIAEYDTWVREVSESEPVPYLPTERP